MDAFRNALGDEQLQQHIFSRKVTTLTEAITLATEMEAFLDWQAQQRKNKQGVVDVSRTASTPSIGEKQEHIHVIGEYSQCC